MNKFKKEENKKYQESVKNMNQDDKKNYDFLLTLQNQFENLTNELHVKLFPEEFDFMLDSNSDAHRRAQGINPMSEEYINEMNEKRIKLGFLHLTQNGYAQDSNKTKEYCKQLIIKEKDYISIKVFL